MFLSLCLWNFRTRGLSSLYPLFHFVHVSQGCLNLWSVVSLNSLHCEPWPSDEMSSFDRSDPCKLGWIARGCVVVGDEVRDCSRCVPCSGVGFVLRCGVCQDGRFLYLCAAFDFVDGDPIAVFVNLILGEIDVCRCELLSLLALWCGYVEFSGSWWR